MKHEQDTPEAAWEEIRSSVAERNHEAFSRRVEVSRFINRAYDDATEELADHCEEFHKLYPHDLYFQFGAQNIRNYNEEFRETHLGFLDRFIAAYFNNEKKSKTFEANPVTFAAGAFKKLHSAARSIVKETYVEGNRAVMLVEITGGFIYRRTIGTMDFRFEFERDSEGYWRLTCVRNVDELTPPILDVAETFWPKSWDLGISF